MAFISPQILAMAKNQSGGGLNTAPSPGFFQRMMGMMGGGQGGNPQPVGAPAGGGFRQALGTALAAPGLATMPDMGAGMVRPMPIGAPAQGPMINPGQTGGGVAQPMNPLWQKYLTMLQGSARPMAMGTGAPTSMGSANGGGMPFGGGIRNMGMKPATY